MTLRQQPNTVSGSLRRARRGKGEGGPASVTRTQGGSGGGGEQLSLVAGWRRPLLLAVPAAWCGSGRACACTTTRVRPCVPPSVPLCVPVCLLCVCGRACVRMCACMHTCLRACGHAGTQVRATHRAPGCMLACLDASMLLPKCDPQPHLRKSCAARVAQQPALTTAIFPPPCAFSPGGGVQGRGARVPHLHNRPLLCKERQVQVSRCARARGVHGSVRS